MTDRATVSRNPTVRQVSYSLLAVAAAALVPMLILGATEHISYDGYWHLFIATQDRWRLFISEFRRNAHPILYFLVLRGFSHVGHSHLIVRAASIIPATASVYLIGLIAAKLCHNRFVAVLAAAVYGLSMTNIWIAIDLRSYSLCLFLVITAFYFLVSFSDIEFGTGAAVYLGLFAIFTALAVATEYYAVFFMAGCFCLLPLILLVRPGNRSVVSEWISVKWPMLLTAVALPLATLLCFYRIHIRYQPHSFAHVGDFYWTPGSPRSDFVLRNLRADLNYLLPIEIPSTNVLLAVLAIAVPAFMVLAAIEIRSRRKLSVALPGLLVLLILGQLIVAALLRRYPFGGFDRQQSILFPFLVLTCFVFLDGALFYLPWKIVRAAVLAVVAVAILLNFEYGWRHISRGSEELFTQSYQTFREKAQPGGAIYLDQFTLIAFYSHTLDQKWKFKHRFVEPQRVEEYELTDASGKKMRVLRNIDLWNFNLRQGTDYQVMAHALSDAQIPQVSIFLLKQMPGHENTTEIREEESKIRQLAGQAGLEVTSLYDDNVQTDIAFARMSPRAGGGTIGPAANNASGPTTLTK